MDRTLNFFNDHWGRKTMSNNVAQTHSIFVKLNKNSCFRHAKGLFPSPSGHFKKNQLSIQSIYIVVLDLTNFNSF